MEYKFKLKQEDKAHLIRFVKTGKRNVHELKHAYVLMALDKGNPQKNITDYYNVGRATVWRIKNRYIKYGLEVAMAGTLHKGQPVKYKKKDIETLLLLVASKPPLNKKRWTVELLRKTIEKNTALEKISRETLRLVLKKNGIKLNKISHL